MDHKIILFELNEVPLRIIRHFCRLYPDSTLARRLPQCRQYETYTEDRGELSPWITWPTLYRGVSNEKHELQHFGQDLSEVDAEFPPLWDILVSHGVDVGICGTLHSYPVPRNLDHYKFYLPDTFAAGSECFPRDIAVFQELNLQMARDSGRNVSVNVPWKSALSLLAKAPGLGFKLETLGDLSLQLASERIQPWHRVRRRTYQAILAFDIFMKQLGDTRPDFATFFTNHVASSMHRYWAAAFPEDYQEFGYSDEWVKTFHSEIEFTMRKFDRFFARLLSFVDRNKDYQLWVATSMGQAATTAKPLQSQLRLRDANRFTQVMGLDPSEWQSRPAMLPMFNLVVSQHKVAFFRDTLGKLYINGVAQEFDERRNGFFALRFGQKNLSERSTQISFDGKPLSLTDLGLEIESIEDTTNTNAYHIPQGCLFIYDPNDATPKSSITQISTLEIAPFILKNYSITPPAYMTKAATL